MTIMTITGNNLRQNFTNWRAYTRERYIKKNKAKPHKIKTIPYLHNSHLNTVEK